MAATSRQIKQKLSDLQTLSSRLVEAGSVQEKNALLDQEEEVRSYLNNSHSLRTFLHGLKPELTYLVKAVIAIGQGAVVFSGIDGLEDKLERLHTFLETLKEVDQFYDTIGGIVGYHCTVLELLCADSVSEEKESILQPCGFDIRKKDLSVKEAVKQGIEGIELLGEIYPVGGAGDRLNLIDEQSGEPLPAALLPFGGRTLLEGLIRDVQAREYLHWKLSGKQSVTPLALMTSHAKNNEQHILAICEAAHWFGRERSAFRFFTQPSVPVVTVEGNWVMQAPLDPLLKPGGHGVIWKLALDAGVFSWLEGQGRRKVLLRQINNPVAGVDHGLCAFTGWGFHKEKAFGFASCQRRVGAPEGMNVLRLREDNDSKRYCITNIEYTDFQKKGIEDTPVEQGSLFSAFPANTNILFADIESVKKAAAICPIPGMIINMKKKYPYRAPDGEITEMPAGRLESIMQNLADVIEDSFDHAITCDEQQSLRTFLSYNERSKTIATAKTAYQGGAIYETPLGVYYEQLKNAHRLLTEYCNMQVPDMPCESEFTAGGPSFIFSYHPALGPLYEVIAQKIRSGRIANGGELQLDLAEADCEKLCVEGSLLVEAVDPLGHLDDSGRLHFSERCGKCVLHHVTVKNRGIASWTPDDYWKNQQMRHEALRIVLHGHAEFYAENLTIIGDHFIEVPDGYRVRAYMENGELTFHREAIRKNSWKWRYSMDDACAINMQVER